MIQTSGYRQWFCRLLCMLGRLPSALADHFREDSRSTLFSAALGVLAAHSGALGILVKLSLMIVANFASQTMPAYDGGGPVVLVMDETHWQERYFEQSPLDRCIMAEDLGLILARAPRMIAVDFDLSPSLRPADAACQTTLDTLLDNNSSRLVLLSPIKVSAQRLIRQKRDWMLARCKAGGVFADGGLELSLGMVIDSVPSNDRIAEVVRQRSGSSICASLSSAAGVAKWLVRAGDSDAADDDALKTTGGAVEPVEAAAINFALFRGIAHKVSIDELTKSTIADWPQRDVFFGGDYGSAKEDRFGTPIGPLPGIAVHAARRVSLDHPVAELHPAAGFAADILIAFVFSLGIAVFWRGYARFRVSREAAERQLASVMVVGFVIFYALLVFLFFQLSIDLFAAGILIVPLVIAVSMLVDGFITGPIAAILKLVEHDAENPTNHAEFRALVGVTVGLVLIQAVAPIHPLSLATVPIVILAALSDRFAVRLLAARHWQRPLPAVTPTRAATLSLLIAIAGFAITGWMLRSGAVVFSQAYTHIFFICLTCIAAALVVGMAYPLGPAHDAGPIPATPAPQQGPAGHSDRVPGHAVNPLVRAVAALVSILKTLIFWGAVLVALSFLSHH